MIAFLLKKYSHKSNAFSLKILKRFFHQESSNKKLFIKNETPVVFKKLDNNIREILKPEEKQKFMSVYFDIHQDIKMACPDLIYRNDIEKVKDHSIEVIKYNSKGGKYMRAFILLATYHMTENPKCLTTKKITLVNILAWCLEFVHRETCFIDDLLDASQTRRNQLCWYRNKEVELDVVNDYYLLDTIIYFILDKHFSQHPSFLFILHLFYDLKWIMYMGETLDLKSVDKNGPKFDLFTMERFKVLVTGKTGYCNVYYPLVLGMILSNCLDQDLHRQIKDFALDTGILFQAQDDYIDCYGDPRISGKQGTDIKEGKCSWFIVKALAKANPKQSQLLKQFYGKKDKDSVDIIYDIYNELNLNAEYLEYENKEIKKLQKMVNELPDKLPKTLFYTILENLFRRKI